MLLRLHFAEALGSSQFRGKKFARLFFFFNGLLADGRQIVGDGKKVRAGRFEGLRLQCVKQLPYHLV